MLHRVLDRCRCLLERELVCDEPAQRVLPARHERHGLGELVALATADAEHVDLLERQVAHADRRIGVRQPDDDHAPGLGDELDGGSGDRGDTSRLEDDLGAVPARPFTDGRERVHPFVQEQRLGAERPTRREAARDAIHEQDGRSSVVRCSGDRLPDRPGAEDHSLLPCIDARTNDRAHRDGDGLDERSEGGLEIAHREDLGRRHLQLLLERAVAVDAHEAQVDAHVLPPDATRVAVPAGADRPDRHTLSGIERLRAVRPDRLDDRRELVPLDARKDLEAEVPAEVVEVGATEPDRVGPEEYLATPGRTRLG